MHAIIFRQIASMLYARKYQWTALTTHRLSIRDSTTMPNTWRGSNGLHALPPWVTSPAKYACVKTGKKFQHIVLSSVNAAEKGLSNLLILARSGNGGPDRLVILGLQRYSPHKSMHSAVQLLGPAERYAPCASRSR